MQKTSSVEESAIWAKKNWQKIWLKNGLKWPKIAKNDLNGLKIPKFGGKSKKSPASLAFRIYGFSIYQNLNKTAC